MRKIQLAVLFATTLASFAVHAEPPDQQIWIAPLARDFNGKHWGSADFMDLFKSDAPWQRVAGRVGVFKFYPTFMGAASDAMLHAVFDDLERRGIKVALEASVLTDAEGCGAKVAGDNGEFTIKIVERIKRLGGRLDYLAMNEPLLHAARQKQRLCEPSIEAMTAANVARTIAAVRRLFPDVQIGDVEAIGNWSPTHMPWARTEDFMTAVSRWSSAFAKATGRELAFMQADVIWILPWVDALGRFGKEMHARNIPFGVLYTGIDLDLSDETWIRHAEEFVSRYSNSEYPVPDMAIFQSWHEYPRHILPEDGMFTLTSLVAHYMRDRVTVHVERHGTVVSGRLLDERSNPIPDAAINIQMTSASGYGPLGWQAVSGNVPEGAVRANFALRMKTECGCEAASAIALQEFDYSERIGEESTNATRLAADFRNWETRGNGAIEVNSSGISITTRPGQRSAVDSPQFPTTPGSKFDARALYSTQPGADQGALGVVRFYDAEGKEIRRTYILLEPNWSTVATTKTKADGTFQLTLQSEPDVGHFSFKVEASGASNYRMRDAYFGKTNPE